MQQAKAVLVTGDVVADHHIYRGARPTSGSQEPIGTRTATRPGGSRLLADLLTAVGSDGSSGDFAVHFDLDLKDVESFPLHAHSYALWAPCERSGSPAPVWRMVEELGYGDALQEPFQYPTYKKQTARSEPAIVVVDDGGGGFRFRMAEEAWPDALTAGGAHSPSWFVLKMSAPLAQGDLWRVLSSKFSERLIVVAALDDLRQEEVRVTRRISWERTALDLLDGFRGSPRLADLLRCRHLIVSIASEGAFLVRNAASKKPSYELVYDPAHTEGDWEKGIEGGVIGGTSCLVAGIVAHLARGGDADALAVGVKAGLAGMRRLRVEGHGSVSDSLPSFPCAAVAAEIRNPSHYFGCVDVPVAKDAKAGSDRGWMIVDGSQPRRKGKPRPYFGVACRVALLGPRALVDIPFARFERFVTLDRTEIEGLHNIEHLIRNYEWDDDGSKPLSMAVFGPPGAGKSFAVKQVARSVFGPKVPFLEFNLSQLEGPRDLIGAFHQVRDKVLEGRTPIVFWDEFDSREYDWLQYLLAPMQDGKFQEGQLTHPIGKCVFVFAGGTSRTFRTFGPRKDEPDKVARFKLLKGPDFVSRLQGYLDVLGPNRRQVFNSGEWKDDESDVCYPIRRALMIRENLGLGEKERLSMDRGVLAALLEVGAYKHGARSLAQLVGALRCGTQGWRSRSDLPPPEVMAMQVDEEEFMSIANRDLAFKTDVEDLARAVHDFYRDLAKSEGWEVKYTMPYDQLPDEIKDDNRAAARRIPEVLQLVGLCVVPQSAPGDDPEEEIREVIEHNLELLAEAEHDGWMENKRREGWVYGVPRDDEKKVHDAMKPYADLNEKDRSKDHNAVRKYPEIVKRAGCKIVSSLRSA